MTDLPQWILDSLTDIKMTARDRSMSDQEFFEQITRLVDRLTDDHEG